jgi:hypothetical protein
MNCHPTSKNIIDSYGDPIKKPYLEEYRKVLDMTSPPRSRSNETENSKTSSIFSDNRGKRWSSEEDTYLMQQIQFLSHYDIGRHLKRSENAVVSRLKKLAFHMIQNGEDPIIVKTNLKLSEEDIDQINNECFIFNQKNNPCNGKFITYIKKQNKKGYFTQAPQQSPEMVVLLEIRTMLRRLLHQNDVKSPKRESGEDDIGRIRVSEINLDDLEKRSEEFAKQF